jgi:hypothetical protein
VLRPEHGIAFENVGLLDNDMTIWHQTFIIPIPRPDIPVTRAAVLESTRKKNDVSEFDRIAQTLMSDYARKIKELKAVLENTQVETALLLRPYDVTRVQNPITEDVTDWSAAQYVQTVKERTASAPKRQKRI